MAAHFRDKTILIVDSRQSNFITFGYATTMWYNLHYMKELEREFNFYKTHQNELVKKYAGKYIVVVGDGVVGAYDTEEMAVAEALKQHKLGKFLVQFVESGEQNITQTFHSRVMAHGR